MVQWFVQSISNRNIAGSIPAEFLLHLYLWVVTNSEMCMSEYECLVGEKKELPLAKNSHWDLCGARPGSSTVVVNSIGFAT